MTPYYRRRTPEWWEEIAAVAAGAAAGLAAYWTARTLLGREPLPRARRSGEGDEERESGPPTEPEDAAAEPTR